jgi:predicted alpha-1,2-mannosidase
MIGSNSAPIIADAFLKGNVNEKDVATLLEAVLKNANVNEGRPVKSVGREGVDYYNKLGYVPYDVGINENAARTLEYAYADFTIAAMTEKLNKPELSERFYKQSKNYEKLFDPETKWMRGKNEDGTFQSPFNPLKWGDAFTEGNSLHYSWSVFHDIQGLINLMGGNDDFTKMLDNVFTMPPKFDDSYYGFTIHEIREMQIVNMGNYAHGNQPIQHMIYLYNYANQPWKAQEMVRMVMDKLYAATPDGYCGDEDNGQTSAWYVFSALGFYPVTPGVPEYVIGSPLFDKVTMHLQNGNTFRIEAENNMDNNHFIQSMKLNNATYNNTWIDYNEIQKGGALYFKMDATPNKDFGNSTSSKPFSLTNNN